MIDASKIQANLKVVRDELNKKDLKIKKSIRIDFLSLRNL